MDAVAGPDPKKNIQIKDLENGGSQRERVASVLEDERVRVGGALNRGGSRFGGRTV